MTTLVYISLVIAVLVCAIVATLSKNLLRAAIALAIGSAALAAVFFSLGASHAGAFELSVGAGLISILFIIAISLIESTRGQQRGP